GSATMSPRTAKILADCIMRTPASGRDDLRAWRDVLFDSEAEIWTRRFERKIQCPAHAGLYSFEQCLSTACPVTAPREDWHGRQLDVGAMNRASDAQLIAGTGRRIAIPRGVLVSHRRSFEILTASAADSRGC